MAARINGKKENNTPANADVNTPANADVNTPANADVNTPANAGNPIIAAFAPTVDTTTGVTVAINVSHVQAFTPSKTATAYAGNVARLQAGNGMVTYQNSKGARGQFVQAVRALLAQPQGLTVAVYRSAFAANWCNWGHSVGIVKEV